MDKILIVDDTTANLKLLTNLLTAHGYTVYPASDGELALEFVQSTLPDLILLDIRMPGLDGLEVCCRLKADERTRSIPIIFISILENAGDKVKGFQAGAVDYITKPFQQEEVLARIQTHLRLRTLTEQLEQKVRERTTNLTITNKRLQKEITERERAQEALQVLNDKLEERVHERTAEIAASNKELEAFAYSVSHDLRAPLRHIDGYLGLLRKWSGEALDEQVQYYIDVVSDSAKKMGLLIDNLLSFSRMGRNAMSIQSLALESLVREVIQELEPDNADRTIDWCIGNLPMVEGDTILLRTMLTNLIDNAIKFTRPREKARIEIGSLSDRDSKTVIFVRDNGVGFDMAYVEKIFGVFQRLHRTEEFEGTGIGLANVHRIIARHGGRIWAEGEPNQGAAFFFTLPLAKRNKIVPGST